jgi:hypothetical protein
MMGGGGGVARGVPTAMGSHGGWRQGGGGGEACGLADEGKGGSGKGLTMQGGGGL